MSEITETQLRTILCDRIAECGGNRKFAEKYGFHPVEVSAWKRGVQPMYPAIAEALGYERVYVFRQKT